VLTTSSWVWRCTREQAQFVAECANLRHECSSIRGVVPFYGYDMWQDFQTGGGGCRIVWKNNVAWISRHSGYAWADITDEVSAVFAEIGCEPIEEGYEIMRQNPHTYPQ